MIDFLYMMINYNTAIVKQDTRSFMDNNRLYWIFIVSLYEITKILDYIRLKMDYYDIIFKAIKSQKNLLFASYFQKFLSEKNNKFESIIIDHKLFIKIFGVLFLFFAMFVFCKF